MKAKSIFTLVILFTLFSFQINFDNENISRSSISVEHAHGESDCALCPDPSELKMITFMCSGGGEGQKCWFGGSGCDVSAQIPCDIEEN